MKFAKLREWRMGLALLMIVAGGTSLAEESQTPPSGDDKTALFEAAFNESQQLREQSRFQEAAERLQESIAIAPTSLVAQLAAMRAARRFEEAGMIPQAINMLDTIINITDTRSSGELGSKKNVLFKRKRSALYEKARLYRQLGNADEVRAAAQQLREEFPESSICAEAALWEAELNESNISQAEQLLAREQTASDFYGQIFSEANKDQTAAWILQQLDQVIADYPDTSVSIQALDWKANYLWRKGRHEEAYREFSTIMTRIGQSSPNSQVVSDAKRCILQYEALHGAVQNPNQEVANYFDSLIAEAQHKWALQLLAWKGNLLWEMGLAEDACQAYSEILTRAGQQDPAEVQNFPAVRFAEYQLAYYPAHTLVTELIQQCRDNQPVPDAQWE